MEIKDQIRIRMDELGINPPELARRVGVSAQSVRFWLSGRSFPGKAKTVLLENQLSFKLDYSEGLNENSGTVEESLRQLDIETFLAISKLPPRMKQIFSQLAQEVAGLSPAHHLQSEYVQPNGFVNTRGYVVQPGKTPRGKQ